jgi:tellurite resistance protein TerC
MTMELKPAFWIGFNVFVLLMLALDLGFFHRKHREISIRNALIWTGIWILLALCFALLVYFYDGHHKAAEFITGYVIEKALSLDNIFVIALIFNHFKTPAENQHKILFWGIIGALVMRALLIVGGVALLEKFHWTTYVFGAILLYTGFRFFIKRQRELNVEKNWVVRFCHRYLRFTKEMHGNRFFAVEEGKRLATPLFMVLLVVESTDLLFALDSIPAILAITHDSFIVYTSNVFAILGLRSLYFALAGIIDRFAYLQPALAVILILVGAKMILEEFVQIPILVTFSAIVLILGVSILMSSRRNRLHPSKRAEGSL